MMIGVFLKIGKRTSTSLISSIFVSTLIPAALFCSICAASTLYVYKTSVMRRPIIMPVDFIFVLK